MATLAITTVGLSKKYPGSRVLALESLDLDIAAGEVYGFLGPNGAGKTTTIRLLMNFIQPTAGNATILGGDAVRDSAAIHREIGYMSGEGAHYPKMTATQMLKYLTELRPLKRRKSLAELIKRFDVSMNIKIRDLSRGNRQKVAILQAFMHEPKVLILDEPTSGLDPLMQEQFYQLVKERKEQGSAVFFSSHNLAEVQKVCDRIGFIREGKLIAEQSISEVAATAASTFDLTFVGKAPIGELKRIRHAKVTQHTQSHVTVYLRGDLSPLFRILAHYQVASISQREINLEEEFLSFYRGKG